MLLRPSPCGLDCAKLFYSTDLPAACNKTSSSKMETLKMLRNWTGKLGVFF